MRYTSVLQARPVTQVLRSQLRNTEARSRRSKRSIALLRSRRYRIRCVQRFKVQRFRER